MKKTLLDYEYSNKTVLLRCDFNVPIDNGVITDDKRIVASLKTINYLISNGAKLIIFSHLGKVKTEEDKLKNSLYPVYKRLEELVNTKVYFSKVTRGEELEKLARNLKSGEILLVENTRYEDYPNKLESDCDEELSKYWASFGDIFINDAYGTCHRGHASNVGIGKLLPNGVGYLVNEEVSKLDVIMNEGTYPFVVVMGGKKVSDKTLVIDNLINKCTKILIGGGMCFTFLKAKGYEIGKSVIDEDNLEYCKKLLDNYSDKIVLPIDIVTDQGIVKKVDDIMPSEAGFDIGPETIEVFNVELKVAKRVVINGPMGVFEDERFANGTKELLECLKVNNIKTLIGGGDSAAAVNLFGYENDFYHISTGGGATLEYLGGTKLPGIEVISEK